MGTVSVESLGGGKAILLKYLGTVTPTSNMYTAIDVSHLVNAAGIKPVWGDVILSRHAGRIMSAGYIDNSTPAKWWTTPLGRGGTITDFPAAIGSSVGEILSVYYVRLTDAD